MIILGKVLLEGCGYARTDLSDFQWTSDNFYFCMFNVQVDADQQL